LGDVNAAERQFKQAAADLRTGDLTVDDLRGPYYPRRFDAYTVAVERIWGLHREGSPAWTHAMRQLLASHVQEQRARIALNGGRPHDAADHAHQAIELVPESAAPWLLLARA